MAYSSSSGSGRRKDGRNYEYFDPESQKFVKRSKYFERRNKSDGDEMRPSCSKSFTTPQPIESSVILPMDDRGDVVASGELFEILMSDDDNEDRSEGSNLEEEEDRFCWLCNDDEDEVDEDLETSEDSGDPMMKVTSDIDLRCKLGEWLISDGTSQRLARKLLQILRNADPQSQRFSSIPKDPRSLYPKVNACHEVIFDDHVLPGEYAYIGVRRSLEMSEIFFDQHRSSIDLTTHIDGLPLFRSSPVQFWPQLGSVQRHPVFIIALYKGSKKPECCKTFIKHFVDEILPYFRDGVEVHGKNYTFHLVCILADAPARAFLLNLKQPTGYFSCSKCRKKGVWCEGRVCFPILEGEICIPRYKLPGAFYEGTDREGEECPLSCIPLEHFNIVDDVVYDSMHLLYLGIMKKLIETWTSGITVKRDKKVVRLIPRVISATNLKLINERLGQVTAYYPCEFQRAPRTFEEVAYWRAHEYRQFLMYLGYAVLHDILPETHIYHFLVLQVYCRMLADSEKISNSSNFVEYAVKLAEIFTAISCEIFGDYWAIYNVHGLLHIPYDVLKFGCLENNSCFMFEAFMYTLKQLVRSGRHPLKQAINRWFEWVSIHQSSRKAAVESGISHPDHSIVGYDKYFKFKRFNSENFVLKSDRLGDSCCFLHGNFVEIDFFAKSNDKNELFVVGRKYLSVKPLEKDNLNCGTFGIYKCKRLTEETQFFPLDDEIMLQKVYRVPLFGTTDTFICSVLLHATSA